MSKRKKKVTGDFKKVIDQKEQKQQKQNRKVTRETSDKLDSSKTSRQEDACSTLP